MLLGSLMGAVAFQKGLGVVHSLAHPLSSLLDTHHGLANAVNLPYGMRFNIGGSEEKFRRIAQVMRLNLEGGGETGAAAMRELDPFSSCTGHSRSKNGVASLAYVPDIHVLEVAHSRQTWMAGTSPAMTIEMPS